MSDSDEQAALETLTRVCEAGFPADIRDAALQAWKDALKARIAAEREPDPREAEIARLRGGIQAYLDGDYPHPRQHRPGNCPHGQPYYEECETCNTDHLTAVLEGRWLRPTAPAAPR